MWHAEQKTTGNGVALKELDMKTLGEDMSEARLQALHEYLASLGFVRPKAEL